MTIIGRIIRDRRIGSKDIHASKRQGYAKHSQESWIALLLKAPRSAKSASTPVKASSKPPRDRHPSVLLRTKYLPAK
jgi:hypothetical protein